MQGSKAISIKPDKVKTTKKNGVTVSNLLAPDPANPQPFENNSGFSFSFTNNSFYLPFLPPNDTYGQLLLEARLLSATHNACITTKKDYCAGDGFMDTDKGKVVAENILEWFRNMNLKNDHVTRINSRIFEDYFTWGNVPIEIVRFKVLGVKKLFIYPQNFLEWRLTKPDEDDIVHEALQSKLFIRTNQSGILHPDEIKKSKKLPLYSPNKSEKDNWFKDKNGVERTLIWYKNPVSGFEHYGLPSAVAAMIYEILEYKGARYNLDNFENNMVVAALLALKGNISQPEADKIAKKIISTHTGDGKRGRTVVVASEEGIESSNFHKMETKTDGSYTEADDKWTQKIILANQWDAILAGIVSPSTLGKGSGFITKILEIKLNTVIRPAQRDIIDRVWRHIFKIADDWLNLGLDQYHFEIRNGIDISGLTDVDITPAVQINEVRAAKGLKPDPKREGEYMKAAGQAVPAPPNDQGGTNV